ncbi:PepSY domain-containing protein [Pseudomonas sp. HR96]|uniref:PepSY domain-containing protein n=1 Tax=Pseudomonas sp. HR96 TaxID=1027966 RepID=UPI002A74CADF|nr:PepSY domain-containing protein [Pseudomonas sp. HR96]WPP01785.1 PepSY domain-containing protein [Pseudomonas sp. HR96]
MKAITTLFAAAALLAASPLALAKDIGPDQALRLRDAGTIQSFEKLNAAALAKHPGATVGDTELEEKYGKYVYQLELHDAQGVKWEVEMDAVTGEVLGNHQDA